MEWLKSYFSVSKGVAMALLMIVLGASQGKMDRPDHIQAGLILAFVFFILGGLIEGFRQWRRDRKASRALGGHPPAPAPFR